MLLARRPTLWWGGVLVETCEALAVDILREAVETHGYDVSLLQNDPAFASLRMCDDFAALTRKAAED